VVAFDLGIAGFGLGRRLGSMPCVGASVGVSVEISRAVAVPHTRGGTFSIRLLGDLQVAREGETVALPASKRTRALLGFLVATGTAQTRQSLCDLLWDGPDDPRAALRWSLTKLRDVVDDDAGARLEADRERVAFRPREAQVDVAVVKALLPGGVFGADIAALEAAAPLLTGEFLDGLDLPACHRFHHWCMAEREAMGALRRGVLGELVRRLRDQPTRALPHARALVTADPLSEAAHAARIRLLTQSGRADDAEAHCRRAAAMLRQEVGAAQAEVLRRALRESRMRRAATPDPAWPNPPTAAPALVGRQAECALINAAIAALAAGVVPTPLLFLGVPGIGKTRLLDAVAAAAGPAARILRARCFEAEMVRPYGCIADALRALPPSLVPAALHGRLAALLPDLGPVTGADRAGLLDSVAELVRGLAASRPVLLLLDDLQWLDEASAALLHVLVRRAIPYVLVAGAARVGELDDNPWAKRLAQSLARDGLLERVPVDALSPAETASLIGASPGGAVAADAFRQSGGNPLLLLELARARAHGASLAGQGITALVADQLAHLSEEEREVLVGAAVVGREFRPELLEAALGHTGSVLLGRISRLERLGLLRATERGQYDFAHDLIRQGVYRLQSQPHRRFLHRQIARALAAVVADEPSLYGDLVHHAGLAEDHAAAASACLAAAEHCLRVFANAEAAATAERGLAHLQHLPVARERIRQGIALLGVRTFAGIGIGSARDTGALLDALEKACDNAMLAGLFAEAAHAQHAISWLHVSANDTTHAQQATLRAEQISRTADTATRCHQLANTGRCLLEVDSAGPPAMALIDEASAIAEAHNLHFVELEWGRALAARWRGDLAEAAALMARALVFARMRQDRWREAECLARLAGIALEGGEFPEVAAHCAEIQAVMARMALSPAPFAAALGALVQAASHQPGAALAMQAGLAALRAADDKARLAYVLNAWAALLLECGDLCSADTAAAEAAGLALKVRQPTEAAVAWALRTCIAASRGDHESAAAHLTTARTVTDAIAVSARARHYLARAMTELAAIPTLPPTSAA
jgi:DNA-binding SARP family transcriptional activator